MRSLTAIRVFIASPGGLRDERQAFRDVITEFNTLFALPDGFYFEAIGWEDTLGGIGRPQALINDDLRSCDFFVLVLWDRWGTPPDDARTYTSGTEEEYHEAMKCREHGPMRQLLILFKAVDTKQLSDPGPQLKKVLGFKQSLEQGRQHLYKSFDTLPLFEKTLRQHLADWLRHVRTGAGPAPAPIAPAPETTPEADVLLPPTAGTNASNITIQKAWKLANDGKLTEAETTFARAVVRDQTPAAPLAYGAFLVRQGQLDRALAMFEEAQALAEAQNDQQSLADSYGELGVVLRTRGDLNGAEQMCHKSLELNEKLGRLEGIADSYGDLGDILRTRGDLNGAEQMLHKSLELNEKLDRLAGMADSYGHLGNVLHSRGDLDGAEQMYRKGLELNEKLNRLDGMAVSYGQLGIVLHTRGHLAGAEQMQRQSLELSEKLGRLEGMANAYGNLGVLLHTRGDLAGAEQMYRKSLELQERLGRLEGMAIGYDNLGLVLHRRGDLAGAEQMYRKSLEIARKLAAKPLIEQTERHLWQLAPPAPAKPPRKPRKPKA